MPSYCDECKGVCDKCQAQDVRVWPVRMVDIGMAFCDLRERLRIYDKSGNFTEAQRADVCNMLDTLKKQIQEGQLHGEA